MSEMMIERTAAVVAAEINAIKEQTRVVVLSGAVEIGKRLIEAKGLVPHGQWGEWLERNVDYSDRTAQNLMKLADEYGRNPNPQALADLSYTKAVALLGLPRELRDELMDGSDVEAMSTRELQDEIARLKEENAQKQLQIEDLQDYDVDKTSDIMRLEDQLEKAKADAAAAEEERKRVAHELVRLEMDAGKRAEAEQRAKDAEKQAAEANARAQELQQKLAAALNEVRIEEKVVEVVPDAVNAELMQLRRIAQAAPCEEVVRLRAGYERLLAEFTSVKALLEDVQRVAPDEGERYRAALATATAKMGRAFEGASGE